MSDSENMRQTRDGRWEPAIPLPYYRGRLRGRFQCWPCKRRFRGVEDYEEHYKDAHLGVGKERTE